MGFDDHGKDDQGRMGPAKGRVEPGADARASRDEEPLPPPRGELPTHPDRPSSEPPRQRAWEEPGDDSLGSGAFELPPLERLERRVLEVVADSDRAPARRGPERPLGAAPPQLDPPTVRLDAQALWNEFISGVPTPRGPAVEAAVEPQALEGGLRRPGAVAAMARFAAEALEEPPRPRAASAPPPALADAVDDDRTDPASPTARRLSDRPPRWEGLPPAAPPAAESASPPPVSTTLPATSLEGTAPGTTSAVLRPSRGGAAWSVVGLVAVTTVGAGLALFGLGRLVLGAGNGGVSAAAAIGGVEAVAAPAARARAAAFDRPAAERAFTAAAAACRRAGGPGSARIRVTFAAPSGTATAVTLDGAPAGTPTGACLARALSAAVVPPFAGGPVTVEQSVALR